MKTLIYVPIEPLVERYTEQWYRRFPLAFRQAGFDVVVIDGQPLESEVKVGSFLDINSTTHYKWSQLIQISKLFHENKVPQGATFFFGDIEFWGLEAIRLLADMNGVQVKLTGFLHAASYTKEDAFAIAAPYQQYTEVGWIAALNKVFVGSDYHKEAVIQRRLVPLHAEHLAGKLVYTGNPIFADEYPEYNVEKENIVVLTNRFDSEKRPNLTLDLFVLAKQARPDWRFLVCTGRSEFRSNKPELVAQARRLEEQGVIEIHAGLTKDAYHKILASAKVMVSHSIEEHFGYCIGEALHYGCSPLLPVGLSHTEFVQNDQRLLFSQDQGLIKLLRLMDNPVYADILQSYVKPYYSSVDRILRALGELYDS